MSSLTPVELCVTLPWPDRKLSPNSREHHFVRARAAKKAREYAWGATLAVTGASPSWAAAGARLHWQFSPPSRRRYDLDNLVAQHKAAQDGIADALGVDDSRFISTYSMGAPVRGGAVLVTVRAA